MRPTTAAGIRAALGTLRQAIPALTHLHVYLADDSQPADWLAVLDAAAAHGLRTLVGFATPTGPSFYVGARPERGPGGWDLGALGRFLRCDACVRHPALFAAQVVDEPWHHEKRPVYPTADLQDLYRTLKDLLPPGVDVPLMVQFSRELWRHAGAGGNPATRWAPGIAHVVQISALEFQDGLYLRDMLDQNHRGSRRTVHAVTPEVPLWSSVQVFGARYGPGPGYRFPRERDGFQDLRTKLDDLVQPAFEREHPLDGIMLQQWASHHPQRSFNQYTLGDALDPAAPADQRAAASAALATLNAWLARR
jgi:hypothetical protein